MAEDAFTLVSPETLAAFDAVRAKVEEEVLIRCLTEDAPQQTMGPNAEAMIKSGLGFVSRMLRAAMSFSAGEILADEMEWGKTHLPECGVSTLITSAPCCAIIIAQDGPATPPLKSITFMPAKAEL